MTEKLEALKVNVMLLDNCLAHWHAINWQQVNDRISQLRQRIYRASVEGDLKKVRNLQRLMIRSTANQLWSIRQVTVHNQGRHTPGVDGQLALTSRERLALYKRLKNYTHKDVIPVKRVYIPKAKGQNKYRPLGLPTIVDRCQQTVIKNALEPHWEAHFEATSYGFRPGRSTHDAISQVFNVVKGKGTRSWILDADIEGAFDHIAHQHIIKSIGNFPGKAWIKSWLKSGIMEQGKYTPTQSGTPQGGVISPLLLNISLHGLEQQLGINYTKSGNLKQNSPYRLVRYADDFVVMAKNKIACEHASERITTYLAERGLGLSKEKTQIRHIEEGVDFLGVNIRARTRKGKKCGKVILITPSKGAQQQFRDQLRREWKEVASKPLTWAIVKLNRKVLGWGNYYRHYVSKRVFSKLDGWMWKRQVRYRYRRHPNKSWKWCYERYWGTIPGRKDKWTFMNPQTGQYLYKLSWIPIERHRMVQGRHSPDNPHLREYWKKRQEYKKLHGIEQRNKLWKTQKGVCLICQAGLDNGEELQVHHIKPRKEGGRNTLDNLCILHVACHKQIHGRFRKQLKPLRAA